MNPHNMILRLQHHRTYFPDGEGYVEANTKDKSKVFVAVLLGTEPKRIKSDDDWLDIDEVILRMAENIIAARTTKPRRSPRSRLRRMKEKK